MKKNLLASFLLLTILFPLFSHAARPFDVEEYASIDELAAAISARFPVLQAQKPGGSAPKTIRLAIVPVKVDRADIVPGLVQRLTASGRFIVVDTAATAAFVKEKAGSASIVREIADTFNADGIVALRAYPSDGKLLITARIFTSQAAKPPDTIVALLDLRTEAAAGSQAPSAAVSNKGESSPDLPFGARYAAAGDVDADHRLEYVFSDGERIHVYRLESSAWAEVWSEPKGRITGRGKHLYLDVADVNANGKPEIFVTSMQGDKVFSSVFEAQGGAFQKIFEMPGFVRVVRYPGRGPVLIGQGHSKRQFFEGMPKEYSWSGNGYVKGAEFPLPDGVNLYSFTFADFGEAHPLMIALDDKNRLRVYSQEALVWESREKYGATETVAVEPDQNAYVYATEHKIAIKGRIAAADLGGDGKEEIILPRNNLSLLGAVKNAEFHCLRWTGVRLDRLWDIKDVPGEILDFQILQSDTGGVQILALVQIGGGLFSNPSTRVMIYSLK